MKISLDFETRSRRNLKTVGAWTYALDPSTDITCLGVGTPNGTVVWTRNELIHSNPDDVIPLASGKTIFSAFNATFEYAIYRGILQKRYGWPSLENPARWSCSMARAMACGLPGDLDGLGRVLHIKTPKDLEGRRLMLQMCRPKDDDTWDEDPKRLERLYAYNRTDVQAEMEVDALLPELPESEKRVWEHDLIMNARGIQIDLDFAKAAARTSELVMDDLNVRLTALTGGKISKVTQVQTMKDYLKARGVTLPTVYKKGEKVESIDKVGLMKMLLDKSVDEHCRQVIYLRQQGGKSTSTAKYKQVLEMVGTDGRVRGTTQYHAAHTGRPGGRLFQPLNIPQGFKDEEKQLRAVDLCKGASPALFLLEYGDNAMDALSDALRGLIVAAPGNELHVADYTAIEAKGVFWFAGDREALSCYDRGESPYVQMARYIYNKPEIPENPKLAKEGFPVEYDIGKRTILGCGFGMSWLKFRNSVFIETAKRGKPILLPDETAQRAVRGYRELHPLVPKMWYAVDKAASAAVQRPGERYAVCDGKVLYSMSNDRRFLVCRLPSGRYLWYYHPSVKPVTTHWCPEGHGKLDVENGKCFCPECGETYDAMEIERTKDELHYWGKHPQTKKWVELKIYGGAEVENFVQATARDLMVNGMLKVESAGYPVTLTVYDEVMSEVRKGAKSFEEYVRLLCDKPGWAAGYPLDAEGWVAGRYRK